MLGGMRSPIANPLSLRGRGRGFTLIELLVVVVIIAILLAVAIPAYLSQQTKAKDAKAKQYLAYSYRDIRSGIPETNNQFPANASMVSWVQQADPELTTSTGNCYALSSLSANTVVVDTSSTSSNLLLCTKSDSGNVWKLAASPTSAPNFVDGTAVPLTVSGNEITDATRATGMQGDGRAPPDSSFGIWEGTTNLVPNGDDATVRGWNPTDGDNSIGVVSPDGGGFYRVPKTFNGHTNSEPYSFSTWAGTNGTTYTLSFLYRSDGTPTFSPRFFDGTADIAPTPVIVDLGGGVKRVSITAAVTHTGGYRSFDFRSFNWNTATYIDVKWLQAEAKPIATPYALQGTSRPAARVQAPASLIDRTQFWIAMRIRMGFASTPNPNESFPFYWDNGNNSQNDQLSIYQDGTGSFQFRSFDATGQDNITLAPVYAAGDYETLIMAGTAAQLKASIGGTAFTSVARNHIPRAGILAATFNIGSNNAAQQADSNVLWFADGTGTLTDADAAAINGFGNSDPNVSSFPTTAQADFVWNGVGSNGSLK